MLNRNTGDDTKEYWKQNKVWYMPACGELGYILPNFSVNNVALNNIKSLYGSSVAVQLSSAIHYYWSSSEYSAYNARFVYTASGFVDDYYKSGDYSVRAFCALPA